MKDDEKIFEWANSKLLTYLISQLLEYKKCEPKSNGWKTNGYMRR